MSKDALFSIGQKAFIEKDGKVLVLNDSDWGMDFPGGKIQEGEAKENDLSSLINSLKREVLEETGLEIEVGDPFTVWYREFPNSDLVIYLVGFRCKYLSGELKLSDEHNKFVWVDKDTYEELEQDNDYYRSLKKYFQQ